MAALDTFTLSHTGSETSLSPAEIERELSALWHDAQEPDAAARKPVSRIVLGNVVWLGLTDHLAGMRKALEHIVREFPCRLFLLEYDPQDKNDKMRAGVTAQCFRPQKDAVPVCCEVIRMTFGPNSARHLRGAVIPLLLPDLQTVLVENLGGVDLPQYAELRDLADRTLTSASMAPRPSATLESLADGPRAVFDLAWFRLIPIRDQMAAFFDDPDAGFSLRDIAVLRIGTIDHGKQDKLPEVLATLMAGWLASKLDWEPLGAGEGTFRYRSPSGPVDVSVQPACKLDGEDARHLNFIEMIDRKGSRFHMVLEESGNRMDIWCGMKLSCPQMHHLQLAELSCADALGAALSTPMRSRVFRDAVRLAIPLLRMLE